MTLGTWHEYRGYRWRVVRKSFGPQWDSLHPYRVEVEGLSRNGHTLWPNRGRDIAHDIIDHALEDRE